MSATLEPVLFIGHGNPMHAITENPWKEAWRALGRQLRKPRAVLCISAHWETARAAACEAERPETIHDFGGFPAELFAQQYPAPGAPELARRVQALAGRSEGGSNAVTLTTQWGLDHGAWCVLQSLVPEADVPVCQLSLGQDLTAGEHFALAERLAPLREEGVLVLASGNLVHNLRRIGPGEAPSWAKEFDAYVAEALAERRPEALVEYGRAGTAAGLAVPTTEHYLPLLYAAAMERGEEPLQFFNEGFDLGSISMRSFVLGQRFALEGGQEKDPRA